MTRKILVVSPRYWPENVKITGICEGFAKRGCSVDVITGQPNYPAGQFFEGYHSFGRREERHGGVTILRHFEIKRGNANAFRIMMNYISSSFAANRALKRVRKKEYDAVLIYQTSPVMACTAGLRLARRQGIPAVTYAVDIWPECFFREMDMQSPLLRMIFDRISRRKYIASSRIVTRSAAAKQYFENELSIHPGRISCIPSGPDHYVTAAKEDAELKERFIGSFNIVSYDAGLDRLDQNTILKSAALIRDMGLISIRIIIVCQRGASSFRKKINRQNLGDIIFAEQVDNPEETSGYYGIANAFLSCEKPAAGDEYSFPDDLINYMHCSRPVIFAGDGEGKRIVRKAGCGTVCDPEDPEALFSAIMNMYRSSKQNLDALGEAAAEYQERYFSNGACVDGLLDVLLERGDGQEEEFLINTSPGLIKADDIFDDGDEA